MDATVLEVSDDGKVRLEGEGWIAPTLQERRAVIFSARSEMALLVELVDVLEREASNPKS